MAYFCQAYPHPDELSKARLTKMVYLADWRSAILYSRQITNIDWYFNHYGPYVADVSEVARIDRRFEIVETTTHFGSRKEVIRLRGHYRVFLTSTDRDVLDFVIKSTKSKTFESFIRLVYSTYPVVTSPRGASLDLVRLAGEYKTTALFAKS